jgi:hypothetical protein
VKHAKNALVNSKMETLVHLVDEGGGQTAWRFSSDVNADAVDHQQGNKNLLGQKIPLMHTEKRELGCLRDLLFSGEYNHRTEMWERDWTLPGDITVTLCEGEIR